MNGAARPGSAHAPRGDLSGTDLGRYHVVSRLGAGGMGEVYRAQDTLLRRAVALKRLAPQLAADETHKRRLLGEARSASALNHPNIAALFDVFEADGETFLVMELVTGESLRARLARPLTLADCLQIVRECAEALDAAHRQGIVHRDIKPENILLTEGGRVKILDFGIAQRLALEDAGTATTETLALRGTPRYLAPEVLQQREPDARADIFALGIVFYEMLAGRHPFAAESFGGTVARILTETPEPPSRYKRAVPAEVDRIVAKMLARDPAQRYATARELLSDLEQWKRLPALGVAPRRLAAPRSFGAALLAAGVLLLVVLVLERGAVHPPAASAKYLAVEPFKSLAGDPETAFFAEGLTEAITARLAGLSGIYVVPASPDIGAALRLEGSVQRSGDRLRITYRLLNRKQGVPLGADVLDGTLAEVFGLQDRLAADVSRRLRAELGLATAYGAREPPTSNITAYDFYLQGRGYLRRYDQERNVDIAIDLFGKALAQDSRFALAQAGLGEAFWRKYEATKDRQWVEQAVAACQAAAKLDDKLAAVRVALGTIYRGTGEYEKAAQEFDRALALDPASDDAYRGLGAAYEAVGKPAQAEQTYRRAIEVRPEYWAGYNWLGAFHYKRARYPDALALFQRVLALTPDNVLGYTNLGGIYFATGRYEEAIEAFRKSLDIQPTATAYSNIGTAEFFRRRYAESARAFEKATEMQPRKYLYWGNLGDAYYLAPGEREKAAAAYQRAIALAEEELHVNPRDATVYARVARYQAKSGAPQKALAAVERAQALAPDDVNLLYAAAVVYQLVGQSEQALELLRQAAKRGYSTAQMRNDPELEGLRERPEFQQLVAR